VFPRFGLFTQSLQRQGQVVVGFRHGRVCLDRCKIDLLGSSPIMLGEQLVALFQLLAHQGAGSSRGLKRPHLCLLSSGTTDQRDR
jgi:hypothetical protein